MAIKNLAIAYNGTSNADIALRFTAQMAGKYDAHLTGLHVHQPASVSPMVRQMTPNSLLAAIRDADREAAQAMSKRFEKSLEDVSFKGTADWIYEEGDANEHLCRLARYFDLLVVGQTYDGEGSKNLVRPEDLVARSGKPLLTVPSRYKVRPFSEYAVVAWDGSRSAARALADAIQILETKQLLDLITSTKTQNPVGSQSDGADSKIIRHLFATAWCEREAGVP